MNKILLGCLYVALVRNVVINFWSPSPKEYRHIHKYISSKTVSSQLSPQGFLS